MYLEALTVIVKAERAECSHRTARLP